MAACSAWSASRTGSLAGVPEETSVREASVGPEDTSELDRAPQLPLFTPRRVVETTFVVLLLLVGIYFLFPKLVGLSDALDKLDDAEPIWIGVAIAFCVGSFVTY